MNSTYNYTPQIDITSTYGDTPSNIVLPTYSSPTYSSPSNISKSKLNRNQIIGISIGVILFVVGVIMVILYFVLWAPSSNLGENKFGKIIIRNKTSNIGGIFISGDTLLLSYQPTSIGFGGEVSWYYSTDGGSTYHKLLISSKANSVTWTMPDSIYTDKMVFKAEDSFSTSDYVTTKELKVEPTFKLVAGPGIHESGDIVYVNEPTSTTLSIDDNIKSLLKLKSDFKVETSPDGKKWTTCTIASFDTATSVIIWSAIHAEASAIIRFSTNSLIKAGKPFELSVNSRKVTITVPKINCTPVGSFDICDCYMIDSNGKSNNFIPGESVQVRYTYVGTIAAVTWEYVSKGTTTAFSPVLLSTGPNSVSYTYTIPTNVFSQDFVVKVTSGVTSASSTPYIVEPIFTWDNPQGGSKIIVFPANSPSSHLISTVVTMTGSDITGWIDWQVGYIQKGGKTPKFWNVTIVPISSSQITVKWSVTQADILTVTGDNTFSHVYFKATKNGNTITHISDGQIEFESRVWVPEYAPIMSTLKTKECVDPYISIVATEQYVVNIGIECTPRKYTSSALKPFLPLYPTYWFYSDDSKVCEYQPKGWTQPRDINSLTCWGENPQLFSGFAPVTGANPGFQVSVNEITLNSVEGTQFKTGAECIQGNIESAPTSKNSDILIRGDTCNVNSIDNVTLFNWHPSVV